MPDPLPSSAPATRDPRMPGPFRHLRPYAGKIALGVLCLAGVACFQQATPLITQRAFDDLEAGALHVSHYAGLIALVAVAQVLSRIGSRLFIFDAARTGEYDLRNTVFDHLLRLPASFYRRAQTGDLMSRLTSDVQTMRIMWGPGLLNIVNTWFSYITGIGAMLYLSPILTFWAVLPFPFLALFARFYARRLFRLSRESQMQLGHLSTAAQEDLAGVSVVKSYALEQARAAAFATRSRAYLDTQIKLASTRGQMMPLLGSFGAFGTVLVLWRGGIMYEHGEVSIGTLIAFLTFVGLMLWPTLALGWTMSLVQRGVASYRRVEELMVELPTLVDGPQPAPGPAVGAIELRGLTIVAGERKLLDDVSLRIPAGKTCALVGRTGAGKTTLIEALARVREVGAGQIFLDGHDVTQVPVAWTRSATGYAPQEAFLFSASIAENIAFGRRGPMDLEVVRRAAQAAGLTRDLAALPAGLDTIVGERGITLSGGQRQRVALARALASEPRVLLLDDSLSSVDSQTEREILDRLAHERVGRTVVLISHRVAVAAEADLIAVLDDGRLVETGTHAELMERGGVYAELYRERAREEAAA